MNPRTGANQVKIIINNYNSHWELYCMLLLIQDILSSGLSETGSHVGDQI